MVRFFLLFFILANALTHLATADTATNFANSPASNPLPSFRKLGKHQYKSSTSEAPAPGLTPHQEEEKKAREVGSTDEHNGIAQTQDIQIEKHHHHHHHSTDKSICGAGVILGSLATTFLVAIVCYIRATRRKHNKPSAPAA